jgi:hypothetical protein
MPFEFVTFVQLSSSRPCTPSQHPSLLLNLFFSALSLFFADPSLLSSPFPPFLVLLARKCHQNPHAIPLRPNRIPKLHPLRLPDLHRRGRPAFLERHDPSVGQVDGSSSLFSSLLLVSPFPPFLLSRSLTSAALVRIAWRSFVGYS